VAVIIHEISAGLMAINGTHGIYYLEHPVGFEKNFASRSLQRLKKWAILSEDPYQTDL
jgi:hypothetical protein